MVIGQPNTDFVSEFTVVENGLRDDTKPKLDHICFEA